MSNFMALRQLIADLINTLLLTILKLGVGRSRVSLCVMCVWQAGFYARACAAARPGWTLQPDDLVH